MTQYCDPIPCVLPDEDEDLYSVDDLFGEENTTPTVTIARVVVDRSECFFLYAYMEPTVDSDLLVYRNMDGSLFFSFSDHEFTAAQIDRLETLQWLTAAAQFIWRNFDTCWAAQPEELQQMMLMVPVQLPQGWAIVAESTR